MSKNIKDWEAIFAQYKGSNLSKKDFCKEEGLSWNQFRYRWDRKNLLKTVQAKSLIAERSHPPKVSFEAVSIISSCEPKELMNINEVSIYLPNHVRCDIKINFEVNQLTTLLKELVALC
jgi:hypothetical protein